MNKWTISAMGAFVALGCSGCFDFSSSKTQTEASKGVAAQTVAPAPSVDKNAQSLCDVERTRARREILALAKIDALRKVALQVSAEITQDDISALKGLAGVAEADSEITRQRGEIVTEVYTSAIVRAGFVPPQTVEDSESGLGFTVGVNPLSSGVGNYAEFLLAKPLKADEKDEGFSGVSLAANPQQDRYFVRIFRFSRNETLADGTQRPIFTSRTLYDFAEEQVARSCGAIPSKLSMEDFNTIPGLGFNGSVLGEKPKKASQPSPVVSPAPAPATPSAPASDAPATPEPATHDSPDTDATP